MVSTTGVKGHAGFIWGHPEVKLLSNSLWSPNLVNRIPDQSGTMLGSKVTQGSCRVQGQPEVKLLKNADKMPTKFMYLCLLYSIFCIKVQISRLLLF